MSNAHTPSTEEVKAAYRYDRTGKAIRLDDCSDPSIINADHNFDRWLATIVAAAEQRGASKALRRAAFSPRLRDAVHYAIKHEKYAVAARRSFTNYLLQEANRADQMEGDDA